MYTNQRAPIPVSEARNDPAVMDTLAKLRSGSLSVSAPTGLPALRWTEAGKQALHEALSQVAAREAAARR